MSLRFLAPAVAVAVVLIPAVAAPAAAAGPLAMTTRMMVERRVAAADGTTATTLVPATKVVPGDRITIVLTYRNTGAVPIGNVVLANPVPANVAFRQAPDTADVSVDGKAFGALDTLRVTTPGGVSRPATADDVTHVRWRLSNPIPAGQGGERMFQAVLK